MSSSLKTGRILTNNVQKWTENLRIGPSLFTTDGSTPASEPAIRVLGGVSELTIGRIHNNGNDVNINGWVVTPAGPVMDVNQQNVRILNINPYTLLDPLNTTINVIGKLNVTGDRIDIASGTSILVDTGVLKLVNTGNNIRHDGTSHLFFDNSTSLLTLSVVGATFSVPVKADAISPSSGTDITLCGTTVVHGIDGITTPYVTAGVAEVDEIHAHSSSQILFDAPVSTTTVKTNTIIPQSGGVITIGGCTLGGGAISAPNGVTLTGLMITTINSPANPCTVSGVVLGGGNVTAVNVKSTGAVTTNTITPNNVFLPITVGSSSFQNGNITTAGVYADNVWCNFGMNTDNIFEKTSGNGVNIDGVLIKDGTITASGGIVAASNTILTPCRLATTMDIALSGAQIIDNVSPVNGDRILVMNQGNPVENGVYDYNPSGPWARSIDATNYNAILVAVSGGDTMGDAVYLQTTENPVVDVTPITWLKINGGGGGGTSDHNLLTNLQGPNYYHFTAAQYAKMNPWLSSANVTLYATGDIKVPAVLVDDIAGKTDPSIINVANLLIDSSSGDTLALDIPVGWNYDFRIGGVSQYGISTYIASDRRVKDDPEPIPSSLDYLDDIQIYSFKYKDQSKYRIGIIADEVEEAHDRYFSPDDFASPVLTTAKKRYAGIEYSDFKEFDPSSLIYHLVNAVKELRKEIAELRSANN